MSASKPNYAKLLKTAETVGVVAIGVGATILVAVNPKLRQRVGQSVREGALEGLEELKNTLPNSKPAASPSPNPTGVGGVVYLLQAGPFFKIGKAKEFEKRSRVIKLQLPYPVEEIHQIKCGDITHVENYWHKRFAAKRQSGEWFVLTEADVAEFKSYQRM